MVEHLERAEGGIYHEEKTSDGNNAYYGCFFGHGRCWIRRGLPRLPQLWVL
jgi:hypothetical protein